MRRGYLSQALLQVLAVGVLAIVAGIAHSMAKPISRTLAPSPTATSPAAAALRVDASPAPLPTDGASPDTQLNAQPAQPVNAVQPAPPSTSPAHSNLPPGTYVSTPEAFALQQAAGAEFFDARLADEFAAGAIPGAVSMPPDAFAGGMMPPITNYTARDRKIVVYCGGGSCDASLLVALRLKGIGFTDVVVYTDGYIGWTAAGHPTTAAPR